MNYNSSAIIYFMLFLRISHDCMWLMSVAAASTGRHLLLLSLGSVQPEWPPCVSIQSTAAEEVGQEGKLTTRCADGPHDARSPSNLPRASEHSGNRSQSSFSASSCRGEVIWQRLGSVSAASRTQRHLSQTGQTGNV